MPHTNALAQPGFWFGGKTFGVRPRGGGVGLAAAPHRTAENVRKLSKYFLRNFPKIHCFCIFSKNQQRFRLFFAQFDEKPKLLGNYVKNAKFLMRILWKMGFLILRKVLLPKIQASEKTSYFYNNLSRFGGIFPISTPGYANEMKWK